MTVGDCHASGEVPRSVARVFGMDEGRFTVPEDFNDPLPPEIQQYFE